jgi:hypothetical protein
MDNKEPSFRLLLKELQMIKTITDSAIEVFICLLRQQCLQTKYEETLQFDALYQTSEVDTRGH